MKKYFLFAFVAICLGANAQITLKYTYDTASTLFENNQLMIINFAVSGELYVNINRVGKYISIYDLNHSLVKKTDCSGFPLTGDTNFGEVLYLSQNLFSTDSKIDFIYMYSDINGYDYTQIYNEDGTLLFQADSMAPIVDVNVIQQQFPIYNTSQGTVMILSKQFGMLANVYSLPGTLPSGIQEANNQLIAMQAGNVSNAYPNPNNGSAKIDYSLPPGVNEGEIVFYNLMGNEVKRFKVDRTFNTLLISTKDIEAGTYFYQLQSTGENSGGKKMVVIK